MNLNFHNPIFRYDYSKILKAFSRESDRDQSFLRQYLTKDLMQELDLFQHDQQGCDRVISKISDEKGWKQVRETLIANVGMNRVPVIHIIDANYEGQQKLLLRYLYRLWQHPLVLETILKGRYYQLIYDVADQFEIREIQQPAAAMND